MANIKLDMRSCNTGWYNSSNSKDTITVITDNGTFTFKDLIVENMESRCDPSNPIVETRLKIRSLSYETGEDKSLEPQYGNYIEDFSGI